MYPGPCHTPAAAPAGRGVGVQKCPVSSSRTYTTSAGGSVTGSLLHGVSRFAWLFPTHVYPGPASVATHPTAGLAMTFAHGAGGVPVTTHSRPSAVNPPVPLKNASPSTAGASGTSGSAGRVGTRAAGRRRARPSASVWSASVPRSPYSTTRAAASKSVRSSVPGCAFRKNTPPGLSITSRLSLARARVARSWYSSSR